MIRQAPRSSRANRSTGISTTVRASSATAAKSSVRALAWEPGPDQPRAERHEGQQQEHLGRRLAVVEEAVAELHVERRDHQAGREGGEEAAPAHGLRCRERGEGHPQRVERLVVPPHAHPAARLVEQRDPGPPREGAEQRARAGRARPRGSPTSHAGAGPPARRASTASTTMGSRITSFIPLSSRRPSRAGGGRAGVPHQGPEQHRVGAGQRGAEDGGRGGRGGRAATRPRAR